MAPAPRAARPRRVRLNGFDLVVMAGGLVNATVVALLVGYWLVHG